MKTFIALLFIAITLIACSDDNSCATNDDCFSGNVCLGDGTCGPAISDNNGITENNGSTNPNNIMMGCAVDPISSTCTEDETELDDGDDYNQPAVPYESNSWCVEDVLTEPLRTYDATFCANDPGDGIRIPMRMFPAQGCLNSDQGTVKVTVQILNACNPDTIRVLPYGFGQYPDRVDWCAGEANNGQIRCTESDDGLTYTFERVQARSSDNQIWEHYFWIEADENIQFDYRVTVEVIP